MTTTNRLTLFTCNYNMALMQVIDSRLQEKSEFVPMCHHCGVVGHTKSNFHPQTRV